MRVMMMRVMTRVVTMRDDESGDDESDDESSDDESGDDESDDENDVESDDGDCDSVVMVGMMMVIVTIVMMVTEMMMVMMMMIVVIMIDDSDCNNKCDDYGDCDDDHDQCFLNHSSKSLLSSLPSVFLKKTSSKFLSVASFPTNRNLLLLISSSVLPAETFLTSPKLSKQQIL